ncbi:hypothetical protein [Streptomyces antibioticus]|uniref:hypothetical protein n=1 Tax=Streptomyces antibioticus TaxID=1890 RepID=UPI003700B462
MNQTKYTEEEKRAYLEVASELGHSRAMRDLGYPSSWNTANRWATEFGVDVSLDELKSRAAAHRDFYQDAELLTAAQVGIDRAMEFLDKEAQTADDIKKGMDALGKAIDKHLLISGKATVRTGKDEPTKTDAAIQNLLGAFESGEQMESDQRDRAE